MQSCDICRKRKVKCDRRTPCARCTRLRQPCTYTDILRKKGPKFVHSYPTIYTSTPAGLSTSASTSTSTGTLASVSVSASASGSSEALVQIPVNATIEGLVREHAEFRGVDSASGSGYGSGASASAGSGSEFDDELDLDLDLDMDLELEFGDVPPGQRVQIQQDFGSAMNLRFTEGSGGGAVTGLEHTLSLFVETLYPLYPVVDPRELRFGIHFEGAYGASRYALFCAICAAVHAHLASKSPESPELENEHPNGDQDRDICEQYLHAALQARGQSDSRYPNIQQPPETYDIRERRREEILIPFFLFLAYWNLRRTRHAWWYLRESIAQLISHRLHRQDEYRNLEVREAESKQVIFWSLFIAERTFCLLHDKPITLRPWVTLPQSNTPESKIISGFTRQATLLRSLQVDLSGRHTASGFATPVTLSLATEEAHGHDDFHPNANTGVPLPLPLSIQNLEYSVTREWLRAKIWRLGIPGAPQEQEKQSCEFVASRGNIHWRLDEPLDFARAVLGFLRQGLPLLRDFWGGISDQKLCDICECLCDVLPVMQTRLSGVVGGEFEQILRGLLDVLGPLGGRSVFLVIEALGRFSD
ncbi:uncharacterized protein BDV14DRAFT_197133 [Aspergillus stella-maris]|uniref:uncharacterized protein n=1 Tax=Aspergillus stella-maris TaxID=1810926 RepID=UPI003CCCFF07